jgi:hypothetical protein
MCCHKRPFAQRVPDRRSVSHAPACGSKTPPSHSRKPTAPATSPGGTTPNPTRDSCRSAPADPDRQSLPPQSAPNVVAAATHPRRAAAETPSADPLGGRCADMRFCCWRVPGSTEEFIPRRTRQRLLPSRRIAPRWANGIRPWRAPFALWARSTANFKTGQARRHFSRARKRSSGAVLARIRFSIRRRRSSRPGSIFSPAILRLQSGVPRQL